MSSPDESRADGDAPSRDGGDDTPFPELSELPPPIPARHRDNVFSRSEGEIAEVSSPPVSDAAADPQDSVSASGPGFATATLGRLYLRQGHYREAHEIFAQVLEARPDHPVAKRALRRIELRSDWPLGAADLLPEAEAEHGPEARAKRLLEQYRERVLRPAGA